MASYTVYDATSKAALAADITITQNAGNYDIRMVATPSGNTYSVLVLYRFLQDLADDASYTGDDQVDIVALVPGDRKTDTVIELLNGYNIDDVVAEYLFGGSIRQFAGTANETLYSGLRVIGSVENGTEVQIVQNGALLTPHWGATPTAKNGGGSIIMRVLVKSIAAGSQIDGGRIRVMAREWGHTYSYFDVTLGEGEAVAALNTAQDPNNTSTLANAATWWGNLVITQGYSTQDVNNDGTAEPYYLIVDYGTNTAQQTYEALKYAQRRGSTATLFGLNANLFLGITHEFTYNTGAALTTGEEITWTGGSGRVLAQSGTTTGTVWMQLVTGTPPATGDVVTGTTSTNTVTLSADATSRTAPAFLAGQFTGSGWIGAFGFAIDVTDVTVNDSFTDLTGTTLSPPNFQTGRVGNLTAGEFYVLVAPSTGPGSTTIDFTQLAVSGAHAATSTTLTVTTAIPADTPASGTIRVQRPGTSDYERLTYTSWSGSTFTLSAAIGFALSGNENVFITYIDKLASAAQESFTAVYSADRNMVVRVRDGGATPIKPFEAPVTFSSSGFNISAIVIDDV